MTSACLIAAAGYVRVPRAWIALPVSPGAKALLLHLCSAADDRGESWYSYAQLGAIVMRSRSAVSGYVDELREAGIIGTLKQKTANGFNYRLKIRILCWADLVRHWARLAERLAGKRAEALSAPSGANTPVPCRAQPEAERRVQPAKRTDPSGPKNNHQQTDQRAVDEAQPSAKATSAPEWSCEDEIAWKGVKRNDHDGFRSFDANPDGSLLDKAIAEHERLSRSAGLLDAASAATRARETLVSFATGLRLEINEGGLHETAQALSARARTEAAIAAVNTRLAETWQPHWRKLSTARHITGLIDEALKTDPLFLGDHRRLSVFTQRAWLAKLELRRRANNVAAYRDPSGSEAPRKQRILTPELQNMIAEMRQRADNEENEREQRGRRLRASGEMATKTIVSTGCAQRSLR